MTEALKQIKPCGRCGKPMHADPTFYGRVCSVCYDVEKNGERARSWGRIREVVVFQDALMELALASPTLLERAARALRERAELESNAERSCAFREAAEQLGELVAEVMA